MNEDQVLRALLLLTEAVRELTRAQQEMIAALTLLTKSPS